MLHFFSILIAYYFVLLDVNTTCTLMTIRLQFANSIMMTRHIFIILLIMVLLLNGNGHFVVGGSTMRCYAIPRIFFNI